MKRTLLLLITAALLPAATKVEILRDEYGVPHIFAKTAEAAAFASGYAQAEDRLEELFRNYRKAEGTMSEAFGKDWVYHDYRQRLWRHRAVAEQHYRDLDARQRAIIEAYQAGIRQFMRERPEQVPSWAPKLEPWQVVALSRYIIWGWPEGEIAGDLRRSGVRPAPVAYHGSNEMLLAPSRTAMHAPIAVIDPHLSWYGEFRFYEMRVYGGELSFSGAAILGLPFPTLGHNEFLSVAMTTGGPDTSDVYEEEVRDGKYRFKGEWRPLVVRTEHIAVKDGATQVIRIESTHHGPIVAHKGGTAYSAAIPYADEFRQMEANWALSTARNLTEAKHALSTLQFMPQNIMIGTVDSDIYYVRNGRVPVRPKGCNTSRAMPGATGQCEWQGLHSFDELVQMANPPQGYMQNCNVPPAVMMKRSPLVPEKWAEHPYLYNETRSLPHQRAGMMLDLLEAAHNVTADQMMGIAFSPQVWHAELWQERIRKAAPDRAFARLLAEWNRRSDAGSRAALAFYLFKTSLPPVDARAVDPRPALTDDAIRVALAEAEQKLNSDFAPDAAFGTLFRVGRRGANRTWPVGGGTLNEAGMATPRAISFEPAGKQKVGRGGQSATQIVVLTKPPQSWMVIPLGESDHPESAHFDDQAEKLFSKSLVKPTYFQRRKELEKHVTRRTEFSFGQ